MEPTRDRTTKAAIRSRYSALAAWFDCGSLAPELLWLRSLRRKLLERATGDVLDVACGTAKDLRYLPVSCRVVASYFSIQMVLRTRKRARRLARSVEIAVADAEALGFGNRSFDRVVNSLGLCSFTDPVGALREMARVCRPGGRILLLEHGRSDTSLIARWQDYRTPGRLRRNRCHLNRRPAELVRLAGLTVAWQATACLGIFKMLEVVSRETASQRLNRTPTGA